MSAAATASRLIASGRSEQYEPILLAVRDTGLGLRFLSHAGKRFDLAARPKMPTVLIIGDDVDCALGPAGFDTAQLEAAIDQATGAVVVVSEPEWTLYATAAVLAVSTRRTVILIETRLEMENAWLELLTRRRPNLPIALSTVHGGHA